MYKLSSRRARPSNDTFFGLMVLVIFFLCGIVVGTLSASTLDDQSALALKSSMTQHLHQITNSTDASPGLVSVFWSLGRYQLFALFLSFSLLGVVCLPIVSGMKGFFLSFSIAAFIRIFGSSGLPVAFALFGTAALITIPCFFVLASQAFTISTRLGKSMMQRTQAKGLLRTLFPREDTLRIALCFVGVFIATLIERYLTPMLVSWTSSFL